MEDNFSTFGEYSKRRLWFLEEWHTIVTPLDDERRFWDQSAIQFAQAATNTLTILNGGALVAIPSFLAAFKSGERMDIRWLIVVFSIGLVSAVTAKLFGFFACAERADFATIERENHATNASRAFIRSVSNPHTPGPAAEFGQNHKQYNRFLRFRMIALCAIGVSLFAIILGVIIGLLSM